MRRRGFDHWLGMTHLPEKIPPEKLLEEYQLLRKGDKEAKHRIILSHIRIGMSYVGNYLVGSPHKSELLVAEMLWMLVWATEMMAEGAIEHHGSDPNVTAYLMASVSGHLKKVIARDGVMTIRPGTYAKGKHGKVIQLNGHDFDEHVDRTNELMEIVIRCLRSEQETLIILLRLQGYNDREIAEHLGMTQSRVCQIRVSVGMRVKEKL